MGGNMREHGSHHMLIEHDTRYRNPQTHAHGTLRYD